MRSTLALCILLLAGCDASKVSRSDGALTSGASSLALPSTYVGFPVAASLPLVSSAKAPRTAQLAIAGPFTLDAAQVTVGARETVEVPVHFAAAETGTATGTLTVTTDEGAVEVTLSAEAKPVPACVSSEPCVSSSFDPLRGECVLAPLVDGSACQSGTACFETSQCLGGACVGTERSCDDRDACTADACDPNTGCLHAPVTCPAVEEPCKVAVCDPATGCGVADAVDGTPCGSLDCTTAHVCLAGQCKALAVPNGMECAPESPCQAKGTCQAQVCVRPPAAPLSPAWTYSPPADATLFFNGLADVLGNLYWVERSQARGAVLVSTTPSGFERWRVTLGGPARTDALPGQLGLALVTGDLVVTAFSTTSVEARHTTDGSLAWSAPLLAELTANLPGDPIDHLVLGPMVDDGHGGLFVVVDAAHLSPQPRMAEQVVRLDAQTGALVWTARLPSLPTAAGSDEQGALYLLGVAPTDAGSTTALQAYESDGGLRYVAPAGWAQSFAVRGGRIVLPHGTDAELHDAATGRLIAFTRPSSSFWAGWGSQEPLVDDAAAYVLGSEQPLCLDAETCPAIAPQLGLSSVAAPPSSATWHLELTGPAPGDGAVRSSAPSLTGGGEVLFAQFHAMKNGPWALPPPVLRAITASGVERFACELPGSNTGTGDLMLYDGPTLLSNGRWLVAAQPECTTCTHEPSPTVMAFDVAGITAATSGWTTAGGNAQRSGRSR